MSLAFGGLFSPGQVVTGPGGPMYYGTGGSALNALGLDISFVPPDPYAGGHVDIPAVPVGPIGATAGLVDILGQALGLPAATGPTSPPVQQVQVGFSLDVTMSAVRR